MLWFSAPTLVTFGSILHCNVLSGLVRSSGSWILQKEQIHLQCWVWHKDLTAAACHSPAWLLTDCLVTWRSQLLDPTVEFKNSSKLYIEGVCPSSGSLPEKVSFLTVSKGGYFSWFHVPWLWVSLALWCGTVFCPCSVFGDLQSKLWILPGSLGNYRCVSKQWGSSWAWAGGLRSIAWEVWVWAPDLFDSKCPDFQNWLRSFVFWMSSNAH